jgi:hypothetical protein
MLWHLVVTELFWDILADLPLLAFGSVTALRLIEFLRIALDAGQQEFCVRQALLSLDMPMAIYFYRTLVTKFDRLMMKSRGAVPFSLAASPEVISQLAEYIERSESVAFALLDV